MRAVTKTTVSNIFFGTLIFSPLAFGAVEIWSVLIMEAGIFSALAIYLFFIQKQDQPGLLKAPGLIPLSVLLCYILIQAIPLPQALIRMISPATFALYSQSVWVADPGAWATLSLYPKGTVSEFIRLSSYAGAYLLTTQLLSDSDRFRRTAALLSAFAAALAFFSIIQHLFPNGRIYWIRTLTQGGSLFGPYVNRNHFAGLMGMLFPIVMAHFLLSRPSSKAKSLRRKISDLLDRSLKNVHLLQGFGALVAALSIFLSLSRGGIMSFFVSLSLLGFLLSRRIKIRGGGLLFIAMVIVLFYAVGWFGWTPIFDRFRAFRTLQGEISELRFDIWKDSLGLVRDFPLTGTGAGSFLHAYPAYRTIRGEGIANHAHNDHLELLTDGGIIGAGLFICFIAAVLKQSYRAFLQRKDRYARHIFAGSLAGVAAFLLHGLTDFNFFIGANGLYLFLLLGLAVNAANLRTAGDQHPPAFTGGPSLRKVAAWGAAGLLLLSILFNTGQLLSSILRAEVSHMPLSKAAPESLSFFQDTLSRASFMDPLEPLHPSLLSLAAAEHSDSLSEFNTSLRAVRLSPSNARYLQALGSALEKTGNTAGAGKLFAQSITRARKDTDLLRQYGSFLLRVREKEAALRVFKTALALEPQRIKFYTTLLVLEGLSDAEILGSIPDTPESHLMFAEYLDAAGSPAQALSVFEKAAALLLRANPESPDIYWRLAQFASKKSRFKEALEILQAAGERFPKDITIRLAVAGYHEKLGAATQAVDAYRIILSLDPGNRTAEQRMKALTGKTTP